MKRRAWFLGVTAVSVGAAHILFTPESIAPSEPWIAPSPPALEGVLAPNDRLASGRIVARGAVLGPESISIGADGDLYAGLEDGRVVRVDAHTGALNALARTGSTTAERDAQASAGARGRPLGTRFDAKGNLIVADAYRGLLSVSRESGAITVLSRGAASGPLRFTDDLDIASDGRIYFSDASDTYDRARFREAIVENNPRGRLLRYDPTTGTTETLLDDLCFANGVQLAPDESFVLVVETARYRIRRYHLTGEHAGSADVFADNLPGIPDNIRPASKGGYWVALGGKRSAILDAMHAHPFMKRLIAKTIPLGTLQELVTPKIGLAVRLDATGKVVSSLWDPHGSVIWGLTEVREEDGCLYLGTLTSDRIAVVDLAQLE